VCGLATGGVQAVEYYGREMARDLTEVVDEYWSVRAVEPADPVEGGEGATTAGAADGDLQGWMRMDGGFERAFVLLPVPLQQGADVAGLYAVRASQFPPASYT